MTRLTPETKGKLRPRSRLVHLGRDTELSQGFVNVPPFRGSTVLYPDVATLKKRASIGQYPDIETLKDLGMRYTYGTRGTPSTEMLCAAWTDVSGAAGTMLVPSGLAAIIGALLSVVSAGDHILMTDSVYLPTRSFCNTILKRMAVETTYYDPAIGAGIADLIRDNTRVIFVESPGSQSIDMQDIPAIAAVAHQRDICVIADNTWATPLFFPPHERGIDIAVEAGTKYLSGHSDLLLGMISANERWLDPVRRTVDSMAIPAGPEDVFLGLRGLRTMELRLREAERQALGVALWLNERPEVLRVLHPALPDHPGHAIWKRDFSGSSGLFSIVLRQAPEGAVAAFLDSLELFGMGYSWGGFESLVIPFDCTAYRTATKWTPGGPTLRFSIGLEDIEDLKNDLDCAFTRLREYREA